MEGLSSRAAYCLCASLAEPLKNGGDMHLIGFIVACQRVHHEVDAEAEGLLALRLAAGYDRIKAAALIVDRPGAGIIVGADDHRRDAVIDAVFRRLDPE